MKKKKAWKPRRERGKQPTLTGQPPLGYLNSFYCPICGKLLYVCSPYRGEIRRNKEYARELTKAAINSGFAPVTCICN